MSEEEYLMTDEEGKTACYFYGRGNGCRNGDQCPYSHDLEFLEEIRLNTRKNKLENRKAKNKALRAAKVVDADDTVPKKRNKLKKRKTIKTGVRDREGSWGQLLNDPVIDQVAVINTMVYGGCFFYQQYWLYNGVSSGDGGLPVV